MGGSKKSPNTKESVEESLRGLARGLPEYLKTFKQELPGSEQALIDTQKLISPQQSKLNLELFRDFGPELNRIGAGINSENQLTQALSDLNVLQGPGQETLTTALDQLFQADPQFNRVREQGANSLIETLRGLSGPIGANERESIYRGLNSRQQTLGLTGIPSNTESISQALVFGDRQNSRRQQLLGALQVATGFMPASRTGFDPIQIALGRQGINNQGAGRQGNAQGVGGLASGAAGNVFNLAGSLQGQSNELNNNRPSRGQSVLGGAATGASIGGVTGDPIAAGVGGVIGGISGLFL